MFQNSANFDDDKIEREERRRMIVHRETVAKARSVRVVV